MSERIFNAFEPLLLSKRYIQITRAVCNQIGSLVVAVASIGTSVGRLRVGRSVASFGPIIPLHSMLLAVVTMISAFHESVQLRQCSRSRVPTAVLPPQARHLAGRLSSLSAPLAASVASACASRPLVSVSTAFAAGCACGVAVGPVLSGCFARYATAEDVPAALFRKRRTLTAKVIKVADGDTFRVAHLPPLSLLRGKKGQSKAVGGDAKLSESTLQVRIAAVDCPETAKFGQSGQEFGDAATEFVRSELEGKRVRIKLLSRDQYQRAVATVTYRGFLRRKNLSEELLKRGLATVYRQGGAQYDARDGVQKWDRIEATAKRKRKGLWAAGKAAVDPAAYKRQVKQKR